MITATAPVPKRVKLVVKGVKLGFEWVLEEVLEVVLEGVLERVAVVLEGLVPVELEDKMPSLIFLRWVSYALFPLSTFLGSLVTVVAIHLSSKGEISASCARRPL